MKLSEKRMVQVAIGKCILAQITSLNKSIAQANGLGIKIEFVLAGTNYSPEIRRMYVYSGRERMTDILEEVLK